MSKFPRVRLATLLAKARRWRDRAVSRDDEQNTSSKNLLLLFHVKRIIVRRNIEISRLSRAWFIVVFAKRPVPVFRAVEKRDRMPASASADFFDVSSRSSSHTHKKTLDKNANIKKRRGSRLQLHFFGAFRHASRAKSARTTSSSSSSSPALDPLLRVLSAAKTKRCSARARVCVVVKKKRTTKNTHLGGTNAFSPSTLPPCDPGAAAYAWSSKSKLCSLAGVRPGIPYLCSSSFSSSKVVTTTAQSVVGNKLHHKLFSFFREQSFRAYFLNSIFRVLKNL